MGVEGHLPEGVVTTTVAGPGWPGGSVPTIEVGVVR